MSFEDQAVEVGTARLSPAYLLTQRTPALTRFARPLTISYMSLLWTLRKFVDSVEHREAEATRRRACDGACRQRHGDGGEDGEASAAAETEPLRRCRVCGHRSRAAYCPECLADTMVPDGDSGKP